MPPIPDIRFNGLTPIQKQQLLDDLITFSQNYEAVTERPSPLVGEISEIQAALTLNLRLYPQGQKGSDGVIRGGGGPEVQIKSRFCNPTGKLEINMSGAWGALVVISIGPTYLPTSILIVNKSHIHELLVAARVRASGAQFLNYNTLCDIGALYPLP